MGSRRISGPGLLAAALAWLANGHMAQAASDLDQAVADTVQLLADLTALDADCRGLSVNFGIGFEFASARGVVIASVLPAGPMRPLFEKDLRDTRATFAPEVECTELAHHYAIMVPGSVTFADEQGRNS